METGSKSWLPPGAFGNHNAHAIFPDLDPKAPTPSLDTILDRVANVVQDARKRPTANVDINQITHMTVGAGKQMIDGRVEDFKCNKISNFNNAFSGKVTAQTRDFTLDHSKRIIPDFDPVATEASIANPALKTEVIEWHAKYAVATTTIPKSCGRGSCGAL